MFPGIAGDPMKALMLMQMGAGFLAPGYNQAQRMSQGMSGIAPAMMQMMQFSEMQRKMKEAEDVRAALDRMSGDMSAYQPKIIETQGQSLTPQASSIANAANMAAPPSTPAPQLAQSRAPWAPPETDPMAALKQAITTPPPTSAPQATVIQPKHTFMGDMAKVAPEAFVKARLEAMTKNPYESLPEAAQAAIFFANNKGLREFSPAFFDKERDTAHVKNTIALYGEDWKSDPQAVAYFNRVSGPAQNFVPPIEQARVDVQKDLYKTYTGDAYQAADIMPMIDRMAAGFGEFKSGPMADVRLGLAQLGELVGIETEGLDEGQLMKSLQSYLTPRMRVPGSGATSDMEMKAFLDSLPNLLRTEGGNQRVVDVFTKMAQRKTRAAEIAGDFFAKGELTVGAVEGQLKKEGLARIIADEEIIELRRGNLTGMPLTEANIKNMPPSKLLMIDTARLNAQQRVWLDQRLKEIEGRNVGR